MNAKGNAMVRIRDPLHGTVQLSDLEEKLLDTPQMQRLRGVRQLAMAYLVYPGANHTRFEHSIGTLYLADRMCRELGFSGEKAAKVRLSALLHDVGHTAFSHEAEAVLAQRIGDHEKIGSRIVRSGEIADAISERYSPGEIAGIYDSPLGEIITSDIGADRMDYLLRDSHYTGVAYGVIDSDRICSTVGLDRNGLFVQERGLAAAESLLVARFTMFSTVYLHKTVRIASRMLQQAISLALKDGTLAAEDSFSMTDSTMLEALSGSREGGEYARRLKERRLYKKAYSLPAAKLRPRPADAEGELSEKCGCTVLVDVPRLPMHASIRLDCGGRKVPLSSASELVSSLQKMQKSRSEAIVMCEGRFVKKAAAAAQRFFGK